MTNSSLITIITPFFNSFDNFKETFDSVINQTYSNWHWIIVDDFSSIEQSENLKLLVSNDERISLITNQKNLGAGESRNIALDQIIPTSKYLTFIDADDFWEKDFLYSYLELFKIYNFDILYGGYFRINGNKKDSFIPKRVHNEMNILQGCDISCLATVIKLKQEEFPYRFGLIPVRNDLVFFWSIIKNYTCHPVPLTKATYRLSPNTISSNKFNALKWQWIVSFKIANLSFIQSVVNCTFWIIRGLLKYHSIR